MYSVEIYSGGVYCGNALKETYDECVEFFESDEFCDKAIIRDLISNKRYSIRKRGAI
jgi:hypothetical protein